MDDNGHCCYFSHILFWSVIPNRKNKVISAAFAPFRLKLGHDLRRGLKPLRCEVLWFGVGVTGGSGDVVTVARVKSIVLLVVLLMLSKGNHPQMA